MKSKCYIDYLFFRVLFYIFIWMFLFWLFSVSAKAQNQVDLFKQIKLKLPNTKTIEMKPRYGVFEIWVTTTDGKSYYLLGDKLVEMEHPDVTKAKMEMIEKAKPWYCRIFY